MVCVAFHASKSSQMRGCHVAYGILPNERLPCGTHTFHECDMSSMPLLLVIVPSLGGKSLLGCPS